VEGTIKSMCVRERVGLLTLFTRWNIKVTVYGGKGGVTNNIFIRWKIILSVCGGVVANTFSI
jgi:hypothetical protein